jgi:TPR repeat protein
LNLEEIDFDLFENLKKLYFLKENEVPKNRWIEEPSFISLDKYDFISKENKILSDRIQQLEVKKSELQNKVNENDEVKLLLEIGKKSELGIDITKNHSEATKYFKRAAEKGDSEGINCYIRSICM